MGIDRFSLRDCFFRDWEVRGRKIANWHLVWSMYRANPAYHVLVRYRLYCWSRHARFHGAFLVRAMLNKILFSLSLRYGVEINCREPIGFGISFPHPHDIVIGREALIGERVTIFNGVTLGGRKGPNGMTGYPTIESDCIIYPGAKILGGITLGQGAMVAANSVVLQSVPAYGVVGGIPARQLKKKLYS